MKTNKTTSWIGLALAVSIPTMAQAQGFRERAQDRQEAQKDQAHVWDDQRDLDQLQGILVRLDRSQQTRAPRLMNEVDAELQGFVRREWTETANHAGQARAEANHDAHEARVDDRNANVDVDTGRPGAYGRDAHATRDDERNLHKDERDARAEQGMAFQVRRISAQLDPLYGRRDDVSLNRKRALLVELIELGKRQLARDHHDEHEDHHELRQDYRR